MALLQGTVIDVELVDIFTKCKATLVAHLHHLFPNENLIYHGYLGCSPMYPTVAILICMFAAFCQSHWVCPHFSIQAQCKALCHLHHISQFVSYQPYLCTQQFLRTILKSGNFKNECPTCFYCLELEPLLGFDWLISIDGNNMYGTIPCDDLQENVNKFKDEVKFRKMKNMDVDCNTRSDICKKIFSVFKESGIFVMTCHNWFILLACNMIKSGEL
ncbi:hypothetical protein J3A83DRAFT_4362973 [Scleroderma citrinum]